MCWTSTAQRAWPLHELREAAGLRLPGPLVATGGGGWHHWFTPTGLGNRPPTAWLMSTGAAAAAASSPHQAATSPATATVGWSALIRHH
jgi:hypothetical protein